MDRKIILFIFLFLLLTSVVSASVLTLDLGVVTQKQGDCFNIFEPCDNCSYMNITIMFPNGTAIVENEAMTNLSSAYYYNYTFCDTDTLGLYPLIIHYDEDGSYLYSDTDFFEVTYSGTPISEAQAILYIGLIAILVFIFLTTFFGIGLLPAMNTRDAEGKILSISYLKYLRTTLWFVEWMFLVAIFYLTSNLAFAYLGEQLFARTLFMLFQICLGLTPVIVIVWIAWILASIINDRGIRNLWERGMFPQGKL